MRVQINPGSMPRLWSEMKERWHVVLLPAVAMLVYANTLWNGFTLDDHDYIFDYPAVTHFSVTGLFEPYRANNVLRPVTFGTLALNWSLGGSHPWGYHLFNVLLHAVATLLLYLVLRKLLEITSEGETVAWVTSLLFAVHPIHTEAVASIVGRSELLAAGFLLAAWLLHLDDRRIPALICLLLALMSKESAVVFLPLMVAGDYVRGKLKPLWRYAWFAGVIGLYLMVFWRLKGGRFGETAVSYIDNPLASFPASLRIFNALRIAWIYLKLHAFPVTLSCDYSYNAILLYSNFSHLAPAAVASLIVLGLWLWMARERKMGWFLAGALFICSFAATSNVLIATGTIMGERLAYLPSAGFCLLVALAWTRLRAYRVRVAYATIVILMALLSVRTVRRNRDWRDDFSLFSKDVRAVPGSAKAHSNLGGEYMHMGELEAARSEFQSALRIFPDFPPALERYGITESLRGHDENALWYLEKGLSEMQKEDKNYELAVMNLATQEIKMGKNEDALKLLDREIDESRGDARAWSKRALLHYERREWEWARRDAETALRLDPADTEAANLLKSLNAPAVSAPHP